jgi:hypothetical protein
MIDGEDVVPTAHEDITVLNNDCCLPLEVVCEHIEKLMALAKKEDSRGIKEELKRIVPEYEPQF